MRASDDLRQPQGVQPLPVRVYEGEGRLMVAAPLPGLEPQDISVIIAGDRVTIHGELRGPGQNLRDLHVAEWQVGPYHRELTLPQPVDGARANATFGNGVLVLACPKVEAADAGSQAPQTIHLVVLEPPRGSHVGHAGRDMHESSAAEHRQQREEVTESAHKSVPLISRGPVNS